MRTLRALAVLIAVLAAACGDSGSTTTTTVGGLDVVAGRPVTLHPDDAEQISSVVVSHDGRLVVMAAHQGGEWRLLAVPVAGGAAVTLHEGISQVGALEVSPDSQTAVYLAATGDDGRPELFATPLSGQGTPVRLLDGSPRLAGFTPFAITPDSSRVLFRVGAVDGEALVAAPITGGDAVVLATATDTGHAGLGAAGVGYVATDSQVVFLGDLDGDQITDLFVAPLTGGAPTRVNTPAAAEPGITDFQVTEDGETVVFTGDLVTPGVAELFSAPLEPPGQMVRINDELPEFGQVVVWAIDKVQERVLFVVGESADLGAGLFVAPLEGGPDTLLAARPSDADPNTLIIDRFDGSPDGRRVAAEVFGTEGRWVVSVPIEGGEVIQLHPDGFTGRLVGFSPDSQTVVFLLDDALASAPAAGGEARQLTARLPVLEARAVSESGLVLFTAGDTRDTLGLFAVAPEGGQVVTIVEPSSDGDGVIGAVEVPGGGQVVYVVGTVTDVGSATTGAFLVPLIATS